MQETAPTPSRWHEIRRLHRNGVRRWARACLTSAPPSQLPEGELDFRYTRSGGPGGQHVNTTSTRVELTFDLERRARR